MLIPPDGRLSTHSGRSRFSLNDALVLESRSGNDVAAPPQARVRTHVGLARSHCGEETRLTLKVRRDFANVYHARTLACLER